MTYKINSVFGVGQQVVDYDDDKDEEIVGNVVYVSDKDTWQKEGHCSDHYEDDSLDAVSDLGFSESMESIFEQTTNTMTKDQIIEAMTDMGFIYDQKFEVYMQSFEE
jgi:hypothetical protein